MSSSESEYRPTSNLHETSADDDESRSGSRRPSNPPKSPRKRRRQSRSESADSLRATKRHLDGQYNDAYRTLFNESVHSAAARFDLDRSFYHDYSHPLEAQIGASQWSSKEKHMFYAALERLGQDDVPGIAAAIGTKSIPETRELLLVLRDASVKHGDTKVTLFDIPAAMEVGFECSGRLELAGDALAWYQERFDAKQERERFGDFWLITPEIAEEIEDAMKSSIRSSASSSRRPSADDEHVQPSAPDSTETVQILQDIPEAKLLKPVALLTLSTSLFMNCSPSLSSLYPHWSTLVSPLATKPSIYRTALIDLHTLVLSLTKRLTQAAIIQATSRIRSQGWRTKKGVNSLVKKRDVLTAIDMLGLQRDGRDRWRGVARRCGLRVFDGTGKNKREVDWNELEQILTLFGSTAESGDTDAETAGATSSAEEQDFEARAGRSGTPFPSERPKPSESEQDNDSDKEYEDEGSDADDSLIDETPHSSAPGSPTSTKFSRTSPKLELNTLEDFDLEASRNEELRLWDMLGTSAAPLIKTHPVKRKDEVEELELKESIVPSDDNWRDWTEYRGEWEELRLPVPAAKFQANQKIYHSSVPLPTEPGDTDLDVRFGHSSSADEGRDGRRRKRKKTNDLELPIRGARAYAALQERLSVSEDRDVGPFVSDDDSKLPAQSIEDADAGVYGAMALDDDGAGWDAKPAN